MLECAGRGTAPSSRLSYFTLAAAVVVNDNTDSEGTFASSLPVAAATPVPAPAPTAVPISAPLPPPARPPINAPAAAPPPILVRLLLVWLLPLAWKAVVESGTVLPFTCTEVSRRVSSPGSCSRPLDLACVTLPCAGEPALASVLPLTTKSRASVASNDCPELAEPELIPEPRRTVTRVPAGIVSAAANAASHNNNEAI